MGDLSARVLSRDWNRRQLFWWKFTRSRLLRWGSWALLLVRWGMEDGGNGSDTFDGRRWWLDAASCALALKLEPECFDVVATHISSFVLLICELPCLRPLDSSD